MSLQDESSAAPAYAHTKRRQWRTLAELTRGRGLEGLAVVRLFLAALVIVSHSWPLGGFGADPVLPGTSMTIGTIAVTAFLALSGYLVTASLMRMSVGRFLWHRVLRIMPGYWVALILLAGVLVPIMWWLDGQPGGSYLNLQPAPLTFVTSNWWLDQGQFGIGTVFAETPYGTPIAGSLWSLQYEFMCYLVLAALALVCLTRRIRVWALPVLVALMTVGLAVICTYYQVTGLDFATAGGFRLPVVGGFVWRLMIPLGLAFGCGALLAFGARWLRLTPLLVGAALMAAIVGVVWKPAFYVLCYPALPILLLGAGALIRGSWASWCRHHDGSYGTYLYGFPVQQTLAVAGVSAALGPLGFAVLAFAIAYPLGLLSWWFVERPCLKPKNVAPPWRWGRAKPEPTTAEY